MLPKLTVRPNLSPSNCFFPNSVKRFDTRLPRAHPRWAPCTQPQSAERWRKSLAGLAMEANEAELELKMAGSKSGPGPDLEKGRSGTGSEIPDRADETRMRFGGR